MENINEKIKDLQKDLEKAIEKKVQICSEIDNIKESIDKLNAELNKKKLSINRYEFYLKFIDQGAKFVDVIYINDIMENETLDATVYGFFDNEVNVQRVCMNISEFKDARYVTSEEWRNYFFPLVLTVPHDLREILKCLEKVYNSEDMFRLESFGTGPGSMRRSINPYTLDELLQREGYKKDKKVV